MPVVQETHLLLKLVEVVVQPESEALAVLVVQEPLIQLQDLLLHMQQVVLVLEI